MIGYMKKNREESRFMKRIKLLGLLMLCVFLIGCQEGEGQESEGMSVQDWEETQETNTPIPTEGAQVEPEATNTPIPIDTPAPTNTPTPMESPIVTEEEIPIGERYSVIGNINGDAWTKDLPMERQEDGTWITTEIYVLNAGEEFKVRKGCSWETNFGAAGANGANFCVEVSGTYKIKLTLLWEGEGRIELVPIDTLTPVPTVVLSKMEFEPSDKWETVSSDSFAVQIDDVLYIPLVSVTEFIEKVESSTIDYTVWYDPDKTVYSHGDYEIEIYRDAQLWFTAKVCNVLDEAVNLSEATVVEIQPSKTAMKNCYFIDGRSYEELNIMNYQEIKNLIKQVFPEDVRVSEYETTWGSYWNPTDVVKICIHAEVNYAIEKDYWLYSYSSTTRCYEFCVSKATQENLEFSLTHGSGGAGYKKILPGNPIKSLSELIEEEQIKLEKTVENTLKKYGTYVTEMLGCYLIENLDDGTTSIVYVVEGESRYGVHRCAEMQFNGLERKNDGTLSFKVGTNSYRECSVEEMLESIKTTNLNILDSNIDFEHKEQNE